MGGADELEEGLSGEEGAFDVDFLKHAQQKSVMSFLKIVFWEGWVGG